MANRSDPPNIDPDDLIMQAMNLPQNNVSREIHRVARQRGNAPQGVAGLIAGRTPGNLQELSKDGTLWIVDRILEPQTIPHFLQFAAGGRLPGGKQTSLPHLPEEDIQFIVTPYSAWAPPPFSNTAGACIEHLMMRIGSGEDSSRLQLVSKELHSMKTRIWEGFPPLSERRWMDKQLDDPKNFSVACQFLATATNVFHYLNEPVIKQCLTETYNLMWDHLMTFDDALNSKRTADGKEPIHATKLWEEYTREHYSFMVNHTHNWITSHVERLRGPILEELGRHQPVTPDHQESEMTIQMAMLMGIATQPDAKQWELTNKLHDLIENEMHADFAIFMPMDGYRGSPISQTTAEPNAGDAAPQPSLPVSFSPNAEKRRAGCSARLKYLTRVEMLNKVMANVGAPSPNPNSPEELCSSSTSQAMALRQVRHEMRGEAVTFETEPWVSEVSEHVEWGFIGYRMCHGCSDAEWDDFVAKFEADISNWGGEYVGIDVIKARSKIHWVDAREHDIEDGDIDVARSHFKTFKDSPDFPNKYRADNFLVADRTSMDSYLNTPPPPDAFIGAAGDFGGFILAVEADFSLEDFQQGRPDESPGFDGTMRVLGSLLWDDVSAMLVMQNQILEDLWPLAIHHPLQVYVGPVTDVQRKAWKDFGVMRDEMAERLVASQRSRDQQQGG